MMREIKFRQWLGNSFDYWGIGVAECTFVGPCSGGGINASTTPHHQFTGLLDKNGKEIYEGDIISCQLRDGGSFCVETKTYIAPVEWCDGGWYCGVGNFQHASLGNLCQSTVDGCEVIGNIYENPELLNGGAA